MTDKILLCIEDAPTRDIVETALRQYGDVAVHPVPPDRLARLVSGDEFAAVFLDLARKHEKAGALVAALREENPRIPVMCLVDRAQRERYNRLKLQHGIFSFVPTPIDAFDLARRIERLRTELETRRARALR
ncbi:MAG: hypothetical protein R3F20_00565 [Planctomycetota bacterium]